MICMVPPWGPRPHGRSQPRPRCARLCCRGNSKRHTSSWRGEKPPRPGLQVRAVCVRSLRATSCTKKRTHHNIFLTFSTTCSKEPRCWKHIPVKTITRNGTTANLQTTSHNGANRWRAYTHTQIQAHGTHTHRKTQNSKHQKRTKATTGPNNTNKHRARVGWKLVLDNVLSDVFKPQFGVADSCCQWHFAAPARGLPLFCLGLCLHLGLLLLH